MLRGDDVAELQQRLCSLGFDTGRVDGIFGDPTARALGEFQRNAGLPVDGIVGGATLRELMRLESRHARPRARLHRAGPGRAARRPRHPRGPPRGHRRERRAGQRDRGPAPAAPLGGTRVTELHHPDDSAQASRPTSSTSTSSSGSASIPRPSVVPHRLLVGHHDESPGGRRLAELVQGAVPRALGVADGGVQGMSVPLLRETRMPAVLVEVGPASVVVERAAALAAALSPALGHGPTSPGTDYR